MAGKEGGFIEPPFEYDGVKEKFVKEKIKCFEERLKNFLGEMETDVAIRLRGFQRTKERLVAKLEVIEGAEVILKKEKGEIKEALIALAGFDIDGKQKFVATQNKETYLCTDESILSSF